MAGLNSGEAQGGLFESGEESMTIWLFILPATNDFRRAETRNSGREERQTEWFGNIL